VKLQRKLPVCSGHNSAAAAAAAAGGREPEDRQCSLSLAECVWCPEDVSGGASRGCIQCCTTAQQAATLPHLQLGGGAAGDECGGSSATGELCGQQEAAQGQCGVLDKRARGKADARQYDGQT